MSAPGETWLEIVLRQKSRSAWVSSSFASQQVSKIPAVHLKNKKYKVSLCFYPLQTIPVSLRHSSYISKASLMSAHNSKDGSNSALEL